MAGGPLVGLRVVDLGSLYAAPLLATMLADLGADVVKLEPRDGDPYRRARDPMWALTGRNKRSVTLEPRRAGGADVLHALLDRVDVLVENLPAKLLAELDLLPDALAARHPALVVASVSGFGRTGPLADTTGAGTIGEAFAGLTHMTGQADGPPTLPSVPLGDAVLAVTGAFGVLAACYQRLAGDGCGQRIDVSTWEPLLPALGPVLSTLVDDRPAPARTGSRLPDSAVRNVYRTSDARYVAVTCAGPRPLADVAALVGHVAPEGAVARVGGGLAGGDAELDAAVARWVARHPLDEVMTAFRERRVLVGPVNDAHELLDHPHVRARGAVVEVTSEELGTTRVGAPVPRFEGTPAQPSGRCPTLGEDNDLVYRGWLGLDDETLNTLRASGTI